MPNCIYYDIEEVKGFTFSPITCDHPASITRICNSRDMIKECPLLNQKFFMYDIFTTKKDVSSVEIRVCATFPPWRTYVLTFVKDVAKWENGLPIEFSNRISDTMLRNIIADFSKEKFSDVKLINVNN